MSSKTPIPELAETIAELVKTTMSDIRLRLVQTALTGHRAENENLRHEDNFLSDYDLWMHQRYKELLSEVLPSFIYASEEDDPQIIGDDPDPDLCVLVDPLDTSELAVRALHGYAPDGLLAIPEATCHRDRRRHLPPRTALPRVPRQ